MYKQNGYRSLDIVLVSGHFVDIVGPQGEVVSEQLHDGGRVAVLVFLEGVEVGDGGVEGLLGVLAGDLRVVKDLVVEH